MLAEAASNSSSVLGDLRYLGVGYRSGGAWKMINRYLTEYQIDTSHFKGLGHNKGKVSFNKKRPDQVLVVLSGDYRERGSRLKRALLESGVEYKCSECGLGLLWRGKKLVLSVDHRNGDWRDCRRENLRFLCPNCHTQTPTYCGRSVKKSKPRTKSRPTKGDWPLTDRLRELVWSKPMTQLGKDFGVSDVAVKKRCKSLGIRVPPIGYWLRSGVSVLEDGSS